MAVNDVYFTIKIKCENAFGYGESNPELPRERRQC